MIKPDWDDFQAILVKNKVPHNQKHYYVKRIEEFLRFLNNSGLQMAKEGNNKTVTGIKSENVSHFLQEIERQT